MERLLGEHGSHCPPQEIATQYDLMSMTWIAKWSGFVQAPLPNIVLNIIAA
jgi:hypothetical protein